MKKSYVCVVLASLLLAGCSSTADRLAECEAQGVSRDACYIAEQNRKATTNAAAEKQALENAQSQFSNKELNARRHMSGGAHPVQYAQAAKSSPLHVYKAGDIELQIKRDGMIYVNGSPAAVIEKAEKATVYQQGLNTYTVYKNGRVAIMKDGVFDQWMKKIK